MTSDPTSYAESKGLGHILRDVAGFATSQYFLRFTTLLKAFIVAKVLGPAGNGLWQHFVIISEYCQYSHLGSLPGLGKVLGHQVGQGDTQGAELAKRTGTGAVLISALVLWMGLCAYVVVQGDALSPWDRWGLPILGFIVLMDQVNFTYMALLRAYSRIQLISSVAAVFALTNLAVSLSLLPKFQVLGLLLGWATTRAATTIWLIKKSRYSFRPRIQWPMLRFLFATGFPIFLFHLSRVGLRNIDRVLVDSVLEKSELGIYALAVTLAGLVRNAVDAIAFVIYPIFLRTFGETRDPRATAGHFLKSTEALSLFVPIVLGLSYLVLHLPILWLLPQFVSSIKIYRLLTVSMAFSCLAVLPGFYLLAIDRQNWLIPMGVGVVAFDYLVGRQMIQAGWGLPGVALTMAAGSLVYCSAVLSYAGAFARGSLGASLPWIAKLYAPIVYFAALVFTIRWGVARVGGVPWGEVERSLLEGALFVAGALPLIWAFEKRTGVLGKLRGTKAKDPPGSS